MKRRDFYFIFFVWIAAAQSYMQCALDLHLKKMMFWLHDVLLGLIIPFGMCTFSASYLSKSHVRHVEQNGNATMTLRQGNCSTCHVVKVTCVLHCHCRWKYVMLPALDFIVTLITTPKYTFCRAQTISY